MIILDTDPDNYTDLNNEVEEQTYNILVHCIDKIWPRFCEDEPSIEDYFNF